MKESLESTLCKCAVPAPKDEDVSAVAASWACESVEDGATTLPEYVYKMPPHDPELWISLRENCGCEEILYSMSYLRCEVATKIWTFICSLNECRIYLKTVIVLSYYSVPFRQSRKFNFPLFII